MAAKIRPSGLMIGASEAVEVNDVAGVSGPSATGRRHTRAFEPSPLPLGSAEAAAEGAEVVRAFAEQELALLDAVHLSIRRNAGAGSGPARRTSAMPESGADVTFDVGLAPTEDAVVLLEQDGYYTWQLPVRAPSATGRREVSRAALLGERSASFRIRIDTRPLPPTS